MAVETLSKRDLKNILSLTAGLVHLPSNHYWVDYDEGADVLYISFRKPQGATSSELREDGVIVRRRGNRIVGVTILDASKRTA